MGLREHIERRQPNPTIVPLIERRGGTELRQPTWVRRAMEKQLPASDRSGEMKVAA